MRGIGSLLATIVDLFLTSKVRLHCDWKDRIQAAEEASAFS